MAEEWVAGWNIPGYMPNPDVVQGFSDWSSAFLYIMDAVERFWDDEQTEIGSENRQGLLDSDATWAPVHALLNMARIETPLSITSTDQSWAFWIAHNYEKGN